ncbi:MAG: ChlI component of cobalt chelatase involved in biosynthesis / ChlD component of cobalt [Edaphobacter sp.]|nr:ChlI component of cobalt chelatase involved in biosynthesis / ChlD component of cobalt [Edaphobacter sp.]
MVEAARIPFIPLLPEADVEPAQFFAKHPEIHEKKPFEWFGFAIENFFLPRLPAQIAGLEIALHDFPADVILTESMFYGTRKADFPVELDLRATLSHTLRETGGLRPRVEDLHERVRKLRSGTRYLFVVDSSGSHAVQQRMRLVKGAISSLLTRSFKREDEVAMIVFRGTSAQVVLEPTQVLPDALAALECLPTGGRTPLAAALDQARGYLTPATLLIHSRTVGQISRCMEETPGKRLLMWRS